jgi:hypothetical protein
VLSGLVLDSPLRVSAGIETSNAHEQGLRFRGSNWSGILVIWRDLLLR